MAEQDQELLVLLRILVVEAVVPVAPVVMHQEMLMEE